MRNQPWRLELIPSLKALSLFNVGNKIASKGLKHRVFEVSLAVLQNEEDLSYWKIRLRAKDVQGKMHSQIFGFPVDERGTMKTVGQYFQETYGFTIQHTNCPYLQVGKQQRPSYLFKEVCKIVEGQRYDRRLNERQITALLSVACQCPHDHENDIINMVKHNAYIEDPYAKEFGIKINDELTSVEACILPPPWKMVNGGRVNNWSCIYFVQNFLIKEAYRFCNELA